MYKLVYLSWEATFFESGYDLLAMPVLVEMN